MQTDLIKKYGKEAIQNFWIFIENLNFNSKEQDASTVRLSILKKLSPQTANLYKDIADEMAFSLYRQVFYDKKNTYLYASFEAVSKGNNFYEKCWIEPSIVLPLIEGLDQFNNFSSVLPTEDDYFNNISPTPQEVWEDYGEYDEHLESIGNKKGKKKNKTENDNYDN